MSACQSSLLAMLAIASFAGLLVASWHAYQAWKEWKGEDNDEA